MSKCHIIGNLVPRLVYNVQQQNPTTLNMYTLLTISLLTLCLLVLSAETFAMSLDPDQARHNIKPDLDPNCLTL